MDAADIDAAVGEVMTAWEEAEAEKAQQTVQAVEVTDANPWLRVTGWTEYLQDIAPQVILNSVDPPDKESMEPVEQGIRRLWDTMEQVVRKSQRTVDHSGQAICIEAVRSETGQTPYRPLQVYMDAESIVKHVQPWQQIVAFIARTQATHTWKSPSYSMTPRQRKKWRQLWQLAIQADPELMESRHPEEVPWEMSRIEGVCLDFCIQLLNQRPRSHEYESVLVCAMAQQQGVPVNSPSSPPTSPMAHSDPPPITDIPREAPSRPKTFQEQVQWMVQRFMVRGTHGPMQTLQDWRLFGMHRDRLLYQYVQFTMGNFRRMVHGLVGATREILCELLWRSYMIQRVRTEPSVVQFTVRRQPRRLHAPAVMRYLHRVARFKEKLAALVHVVAGPPSC
ncbi:uncharacterized protein BDW43DRAFT_305076 [Aspergillus alliaceus]|uniref:uncharacterized protein n=1 Tax=Petromyces alliaceus TaxID=209559 RepID=UPI0012A49B31|nr:uncharacterized protein BDW43DRAFT_305076 [Aspergillus alliaceus]KAB8226794.1 hypothetical protein BDW43DRAFT_305076 [Aspergillus alliaceus]